MIDFEKELQKLTTESEPKKDEGFFNIKNEVCQVLQTQNELVSKLLKKQGAASIQVEEMYAIMEEQNQEDQLQELESRQQVLIQALIKAADLMEDLYIYYKEHYDEAMIVQAQMMWNTLCKELSQAGLSRIADENTPYNLQLNSISGVASDTNDPDGFVVKVLKSGYLYNGKVIRKSEVIVNKLHS